ncbi:ylyB [Symbiodinium sp. CCMP2592]|nr:ylyB [Symbiodinium sp. CCMP2592]
MPRHLQDSDWQTFHSDGGFSARARGHLLCADIHAIASMLRRRTAASSFLFGGDDDPFSQKIKPWNSKCPKWMPGYGTRTHGFCRKLKPLKKTWFPPEEPEPEEEQPSGPPEQPPGRRKPRPRNRSEDHPRRPSPATRRAAAAGGAAAAVHGASRSSSKSAWEKPAAEARQDQMKARTEKPEVPFTAPATPPRRRTPRRPARDPPIPPGELENDFAPAPAPSKRLKPKKGPGPFPEEEPFEPKPGIIVELPTKPTAPSKDPVGTFEDDDVANEEKLLPPEAKKILKDQLSKKAIEAAYEKEERDSLPKEIPGTTPQGPFWPPPSTAPPVQPIPPRPGEANYNYGWVPPEERTPYSPPWPGGGPEVAVDRAEAVVEEINDDANAVIKTAEDAVVNTARTTENTLANTTV